MPVHELAPAHARACIVPVTVGPDQPGSPGSRGPHLHDSDPCFVAILCPLFAFMTFALRPERLWSWHMKGERSANASGMEIWGGGGGLVMHQEQTLARPVQVWTPASPLPGGRL